MVPQMDYGQNTSFCAQFQAILITMIKNDAFMFMEYLLNKFVYSYDYPLNYRQQAYDHSRD